MHKLTATRLGGYGWLNKINKSQEILSTARWTDSDQAY